MSGNKPYRQLFSRQIRQTFHDLESLFWRYPRSLFPLLRVIGHQGTAEKRRELNLRSGVPVPPLLIVSTTEACNLRCVGCYAHALQRDPAPALPGSRIHELVAEAAALGVSVLMLAGGEPLLQTSWLEALASHPEMAGVVFTNGTLLRGNWLAWFSRHRQILPVISLEGNDRTTDARRGQGVYHLIRENMLQLKKRGMPYGLSITANRQNLAEISDPGFIAEAVTRGCRLFVFVEYVPVAEGTDELALTQEERLAFIRWTEQARHAHAAHFLLFPGDEEPYGGCLASARGFAHISAAGDLEPCPFAPFSDRSLKTISLAEGLRSELLQAIREEHHLLQEGRGGCALWNNRDWVAGLLAAKPRVSGDL